MPVFANDTAESKIDKTKILVIDDNANFLFGLSRTLIKADFNVISAPDGIYGIQKAEAEQPDLILLDVNMPKMTGFQVKMILNRLPSTQLIPIVFLTALNDRANILNGLKLAEDYITKPVDPEVLILRLKTVLRKVAIGRHLIESEAQTNRITDAKLQIWGESVELYDSGTAGHTLRVVRWAVALGRSLGLKAEALENIRKGALIHDIGKLAIPECILNKPGPLTPDEWKIMRNHPMYGYEMVSRNESLRPFVDIVHYHHERWDGLGYPDRLSREEIPLAARIFSLVDVFDILLSNRPYRDAVNETEVKELIKAGGGNQFDPYIADHFLANFEALQAEVANEYFEDNFSH